MRARTTGVLSLVFDDGPHISVEPSEDALPTFRVLVGRLAQTGEAFVAHRHTRTGREDRVAVGYGVRVVPLRSGFHFA
jgi:hypothetical protein